MSSRKTHASPQDGRIVRGRPARQPAERKQLIPTDTKIRLIRRLGAAKPNGPSGHLLRFTEMGAADGRQLPQVLQGIVRLPGVAIRSDPQPRRLRGRAGNGRAEIAVFGAASEENLQPAQHQLLDRRVAGALPGRSSMQPNGTGCRCGTSRACWADFRGDVLPSGGRVCQHPVRHGAAAGVSLGDTIGDRTPGTAPGG